MASIKVNDAEKLDFRDIYGVSEKVAYIMSAGLAEDAAKVFKTTDEWEKHGKWFWNIKMKGHFLTRWIFGTKKKAF